MYTIIRSCILSIILTTLANSANATTLALSPTFPDIVTFNTIYDYDYKANGPSAGGTLTITDSLDHLIAVNPGSGNSLATDGSYELIANFTSEGQFDSGTLSILGTTTASGFTSGTIATGSLLDFGFSGNGTNGSFQFTFNEVGGDLLAFGDLGGIIISIFDMDGYGFSTGQSGDSYWDPNNINDPTFWQRDFNGIVSNSNTFAITPVPVPAAFWLFGSGLITLMSLTRSRNKQAS